DRSRFRLEHDWGGTDDPTAWLSVPQSIRFLGALHPGGWPEHMARNRALAIAGRKLLLEALRIGEPAPESMIGTLAAAPLPDGERIDGTKIKIDPFQDELFFRHRIEVPVYSWPKPGKRLIRVSAQHYNALDHYKRLAQILADL